MADQVLYSGVACITDLMVKEGLITSTSPTCARMRGMGKAMMGTGSLRREARDPRRGSGHRQPAPRRRVDEGRAAC